MRYIINRNINNNRISGNKFHWQSISNHFLFITLEPVCSSIIPVLFVIHTFGLR